MMLMIIIIIQMFDKVDEDRGGEMLCITNIGV